MRILIDKFIQRCLCVSSMTETIENKQSHFDEKVLYYCYFLFTQQIYPKCLCLSSMVEKIENKQSHFPDIFKFSFPLARQIYSNGSAKVQMTLQWHCKDAQKKLLGCQLMTSLGCFNLLNPGPLTLTALCTGLPGANLIIYQSRLSDSLYFFWLF